MRPLPEIKVQVVGRRQEAGITGPPITDVFFSRYTAKNKGSHPPLVYLRKTRSCPRQLADKKFSPGSLPGTVRELEEAQSGTEACAARSAGTASHLRRAPRPRPGRRLAARI